MNEELWHQLTPAETAELRELGMVRRWQRGEVLFGEGERSEWVLFLLSGRVKVSTYAPDGTTVVLAIRDRGSLLGELSAIDREPRSATVSALDDVSGLVVPAVSFQRFLDDHGRVAVLITRLVVARLRDADRKRIEYGAFDTTGRVAARLLELAERFGEQGAEGTTITMPLSQEELAGWTGASREAVTKALGTLRSAGMIETGRLKVVVRDLPALRARAT